MVDSGMCVRRNFFPLDRFLNTPGGILSAEVMDEVVFDIVWLR